MTLHPGVAGDNLPLSGEITPAVELDALKL
jgi:hypothetical protein